MRGLLVLACAGVVTAGCAGREPIPVSAYMPNDAQMTCQSIEAEIVATNEAIRARVAEDAEVQNKNIVVGTSAALLFLPMALAMDFKGAASTEANSFEQRGRTLTGLAAERRCVGTRTITVAEATSERETMLAAQKAADSKVEDRGAKNPSDQGVIQNREAVRSTGTPPAAASGQPASSVAAPQADRQRELMDRFLRGEISKEEYDRLRAG